MRTLELIMKIGFIILFGLLISGSKSSNDKGFSLNASEKSQNEEIVPGAHQLDKFRSSIESKRLALVVNQTSTLGKTHLVDSLLKLGYDIQVIFAPEHGFRGDHSAGAHVNSGKDEKTGLKITSLYGSHKKPTAKDLKNVDVVLFDIQDVGTRFYTYLSTMHYVMEACAEQNKELIILDRPNPNGYFIDGPILNPQFKSFVGMHEIPVVHGMTLGELALMINGEKWLADSLKTRMKVIPVLNYNHNMRYQLPIQPSPNLPTEASILLYPSLCFFEGTDISVGRGTNHPFECFGRPGLQGGSYKFTPKPIPGVASNPPYKNQQCTGSLLTSFGLSFLPKTKGIYLDWMILCYQASKKEGKPFFNSFFDKLAGTEELRKMIIEGKTSDEIKASWKPGLEAFKKKRLPYLLYPYDENAGLIE